MACSQRPQIGDGRLGNAGDLHLLVRARVEFDRQMLGHAVDPIVDLGGAHRPVKEAAARGAEMLPGIALAERRGQHIAGKACHQRHCEHDGNQHARAPAAAAASRSMLGQARFGIALVGHPESSLCVITGDSACGQGG
jgi:hypothetical protein